jgi:hypothetical protein
VLLESPGKRGFFSTTNGRIMLPARPPGQGMGEGQSAAS